MSLSGAGPRTRVRRDVREALGNPEQACRVSWLRTFPPVPADRAGEDGCHDQAGLSGSTGAGSSRREAFEQGDGGTGGRQT